MAIVVPELFSEAVNSSLDVSLRIGKVAFDATALVPEITTCGSKIHFPKFNRISKAQVMTKGVDLVPNDVDMTDSEAEIIQVGNSVRVYDRDAIQIKGQVIDQFAKQLGETMALSIDEDLAKEMANNAVYKSPVVGADTLTYLEIESAFAPFGDKVDNALFTNAGFVINSRLVPSFLQLKEFTSIENSYGTKGNGVIVDGVVGYWRGNIPVRVCNIGTWDEDKKECITFLVKSGSLGVITQKAATIEEQREALKQANVIVASEMYAVKLLDEKGVSILRKTITSTVNTGDTTDTDTTGTGATQG